jgi:hypothetical protein
MDPVDAKIAHQLAEFHLVDRAPGGGGLPTLGKRR